jgi:hypothetical protein
MESDLSFIFLISHVFIAKPVPTFAKHALEADFFGLRAAVRGDLICARFSN